MLLKNSMKFVLPLIGFVCASCLVLGCGDESSSTGPAPVALSSSSAMLNPASSSLVGTPIENVNSSSSVTSNLSSMDTPLSSDGALVVSSSTVPVYPPVNKVVNLGITPDVDGFYDIGDVYKAVPATSKLVFVLRHAEREKSTKQESKLTETGVMQAQSVGAKLAGGDESFYYSSTDFIRTRETCNNIAIGRGETSYETVTWDGINGDYFLKVPSDTFDLWADRAGKDSWSVISMWAYNVQDVPAKVAAVIPVAFYDLMSRGDQFVHEVVLANLPNWKRVSILATHDVLVAPLIIYASDRAVNFRFYDYSIGRWANYLSGVAVIVDENNSPSILPVRGIDLGYLLSPRKQKELDSLAAMAAQ